MHMKKNIMNETISRWQAGVRKPLPRNACRYVHTHTDGQTTQKYNAPGAVYTMSNGIKLQHDWQPSKLAF